MAQPELTFDFDGPGYDPALDRARLNKQLQRVFELMRDGQWRTLNEIHNVTGDPETSVSAQLRHLRKARFGAYPVEKKRRGPGLWEYRVIVLSREGVA